MTAPYRENAYRPPIAPRLPSWWRALWDEMRAAARARLLALWCARSGHDVARHTTALGWCARCHSPMAWVVAKGPSRDRRAWGVVPIEEWTRRHEMSISCGYDKACAARMRAREAGGN